MDEVTRDTVEDEETAVFPGATQSEK